MNDIATVSGDLAQLAYALDTFYFLLMGAFVMWMAAGFAMLEAGHGPSQEYEISLTKCFCIRSHQLCISLIGYNLMHQRFLERRRSRCWILIGDENTADSVLAGG